MRFGIKHLLKAFLALGALAHCSGSSVADEFPSRSVLMSYPFPAGSSVDATLRAICDEASRLIGQSIVFENKPGGLGRPAIAALKQSKPDGYTLSWVGESNLVIQAISDPKLKFAAGVDFEPIALGIKTPLVLVARSGLPFDDMKGFVEYARTNPGKLKFANSGLESTGHLLAEMITSAAGVKVTMVPYKGTPLALTDLIAGRVDLLIVTATAKQYVDDKQVIALATTGADRWELFPATPSLIQAGLNVSGYTYFGAVAPAGTPKDVIEKLNSIFNAAIQTPSVQQKFDLFGYEKNVSMSPLEFSVFIQDQIKRQTPVIRALSSFE